MLQSPKPFNLLRSFSILSLLCIALISVVTASLLSRFLTRNMLERDGVLTMQFVQSALEALSPDTYFASAGQPSDRRITYVDFFARQHQTQVKAAFEDFFARLVLMPAVVRANVYAPDGTIIWSNHTNLVGQRFADNAELVRAFTGRLAIKTGIVEQRRKAEHILFKEGVQYFAESYMPIWNHERDRTIGVVEVYKVPDALFAAIAHGQRLVWGSTIVGGLFLYGALFGIVRRATLVMRRQQEQLVMAETMATIGEMASAIAHNLRNPLASMRSSAEVALEINDATLWQQNAQDILLTVDRLEGWIRELLTYARPLAHTPAPTALEMLLQQAVRRFDDEAQRHKVHMVLSPCPALPPVLADAQLLQQAIQSLLSNAFEAMPHGGTLTITPHYSPSQRLITIEICDTGGGIPAEQIDKVFRPFFTTKRRGLGIGLPLAKRIIERHGGSLSLVSIAGQGTTVSVCLPAME